MPQTAAIEEKMKWRTPALMGALDQRVRVHRIVVVKWPSGS
jgi:hypothetical protein